MTNPREAKIDLRAGSRKPTARDVVKWNNIHLIEDEAVPNWLDEERCPFCRCKITCDQEEGDKFRGWIFMIYSLFHVLNTDDCLVKYLEQLILHDKNIGHIDSSLESYINRLLVLEEL